MASFIVSSKEGNPKSIDGIPVVTLQEWEEKDVPIYIAVPENFHKKISLSAYVGCEGRGFM